MRKKLRVMLVIFAFVSVCFGFAAVIQSSVGVDSNNPDTYSWPMYQNDLRHTGYSSSAGPLGNQTIWKYTTDDTFWTAPTIANGILYAGSDRGSIYALNVSTSTLLWRYATTGAISSSPAVADGKLYVGYVGGFSALNASNGGFLWNFATPAMGGYSSPAAYNGVVYTGADTNVYALNASTGSKIWSFSTNSMILSAPAMDNGLVYVISIDINWAMDNSVYALNASTGSLVWKFTANNRHTFCPSPAIADGMVFAGLSDGKIYALDATTGTKLWSNGANIWIPDGKGYMADGHVTPATIANGKVYFGATAENNSSQCDIYSLDEFTGKEIWTHHIGSWVNGPVVAAGNEVFLTAGDRNVYVLSAEIGCEVWRYMTGGIMSSPSIADNIVYIGSGDGNIYAIGGGNLSYGPNPTAKPTATPGPTPTSSPTPIATLPPTSVPLPPSTPTPTATPPTTFGFTMTGNITSSQVSDINWVTNQTTTKISFTVTGESGTIGFSNVTIAKSRIPQATTPVIYVDNTIVPEQGYTQDANNYYVWYIVHFSTHRILIEFNRDTAVSPQATNRISGTEGEINFQSVIYGLAIAFVIVAVVSVVLKLTLNEKKLP
jgi:outer membrane protein assembly factor BamB